MDEIAWVLELAEHPFIWVVKSRTWSLSEARTKKLVFWAEISPKNRLLVGIEQILAIDNRLKKKSMENR